MECLEKLQFAGTGMNDDEISRVVSAHDKQAQVKALRVCRLRLINEVHKKQQELDKLDYLIQCTLKRQQ